MQKEINPDFGFETALPPTQRGSEAKLKSIGMHEVRRRFSPEFVNRIDAVIAYRPLDAKSLTEILDQQIAILQRHIKNRLEERAFELEVGAEARALLLKLGTSSEFGARELKRTILRQVTQQLAEMVEVGRIAPGAMVRAEVAADGE